VAAAAQLPHSSAAERHILVVDDEESALALVAARWSGTGTG
jgi:hypothetical protein